MDQEKPFKTIEVVDSRTKQVCKVACMSCIRGHRTTSCGIPVCRTKVFWTVKRPGRPSNSCTCRYGATGGCKCVVAKSACPHKAKKGEKRSGECRCDEQGRYCCLLEPEHWAALHGLQKPTVDFFPSRELLESNQASTNHMAIPQTPANHRTLISISTLFPLQAKVVIHSTSPRASLLPRQPSRCRATTNTPAIPATRTRTTRSNNSRRAATAPRTHTAAAQAMDRRSRTLAHTSRPTMLSWATRPCLV
jgi:hypothetical protein